MAARNNLVRVRGAREHNLKNVNLDIPRDALVVFTGVSGSGKSSLAFGTLYAEAQRRYLESVAPYVRRLIDQVGVPDVDSIDGLPPAVALQQQRGTPSSRSSVGTVTMISDLLRMLYSRAGTYPAGQPLLYAESFSPNTTEGACPQCHGLGRVYEVTEKSMVPDASLTIRDRAIAAWPPAWHGQNLRDILVTLGYDVDTPWRDMSRKDRNWILFTDDQPVVPVYAGFTSAEVKRAVKRKDEPSYMGTFTSAKRYVLQAFASTQSALIRKRVSNYLLTDDCPLCNGKRLRKESLSVTFAGLDIAEFSRLPLNQLSELLQPYALGNATGSAAFRKAHPEKAEARERIAGDLLSRLGVLNTLGLGYLMLERSTPTLSPGELQRLRLATQVKSNLFGVVYVLDEPSAGLHPADTESLIDALQQLKSSGNSLFVVEHEVDVIRRADWIVDVGPAAGEHGGEVLYSGALHGLRNVSASITARYLFGDHAEHGRVPRAPDAWLRIRGLSRNNLTDVTVDIPLGVMTAITGVSGSGKSTLASQLLIELVAESLGQEVSDDDDDANVVPGMSAGLNVNAVPRQASVPTKGVAVLHASSRRSANTIAHNASVSTKAVDRVPAPSVQAANGIRHNASALTTYINHAHTTGGEITDGMQHITRLVRVDQKPIGRTPRSNLATYTGLFDGVRKLFAATKSARAKRYSAGRFSFNVAAGRCPTCEGEGMVSVELLFLPSVYAPCPTCHGARYNPQTLGVLYKDQNIADVLQMTVDKACEFFSDAATVLRPLQVLRDVGLGYLRLGQPATELSGGEAQRIKLATELQRVRRGGTLYVLDEPTTGLHPADVDSLMRQLHGLVETGNTVVVVEHDMRVIAASDWIIDMGPGAGELGGQVVACGTPAQLVLATESRTAPYLARFILQTAQQIDEQA